MGRKVHRISGGVDRGGLKIVSRNMKVTIGTLAVDTIGDITEYLLDNGIPKVVECRPDNLRYNKIGIPPKVFYSAFWPDGVLYQTYHFQ